MCPGNGLNTVNFNDETGAPSLLPTYVEKYNYHKTSNRKRVIYRGVHKRLISTSAFNSRSPHDMTSPLDEALRSGYFWKKTSPKSMEHTPTLKKTHTGALSSNFVALFYKKWTLVENKVGSLRKRIRVSAAGLFVILRSCPPSMVSSVLCLNSEANRLTFVIQSGDTMNEVNFSNKIATAASEEQKNLMSSGRQPLLASLHISALCEITLKVIFFTVECTGSYIMLSYTFSMNENWSAPTRQEIHTAQQQLPRWK